MTVEELKRLEQGSLPGPWVIANDDKPRFGDWWVIRDDPKDWNGMGHQHIAIIPSMRRPPKGKRKGESWGEAFHATAALIVALRNNAAALIKVAECAEDYIEGMHDYHLHADFETVRVPIARDKREKLAAALRALRGGEGEG